MASFKDDIKEVEEERIETIAAMKRELLEVRSTIDDPVDLQQYDRAGEQIAKGIDLVFDSLIAAGKIIHKHERKKNGG